MPAERPDKRSADGSGLRIAVVRSRFNSEITEALLDGTASTLARCGVVDESVAIYEVPGAFELPVVSRRLAGSGSFDAVIALGAVIRGETAHFELVSSEAAAGIARASYDTGVPVIFGVLATEDAEQARDRSGGALGNRGEDAALAAIEMVHVLRDVDRRVS